MANSNSNGSTRQPSTLGDPFYADRPLPKVPTWKVPTNPEEQQLFFAQVSQMMDWANSINPNVKTPMDTMDLIENLLFQVHQKKLDELKDIENQITANQFDGFLLREGQELVDTSEPLTDKIWPRKGLCLLTSPPGYGKTLTAFYLMQRLNLPTKAVLYAGMDETENGVIQKLRTLGYSQWPIATLPEGLTGDDAWKAIYRWEEVTKDEGKRFLILDLLLHYCGMELNSPGSIINGLSGLLSFANRNNIIVLALTHSSLGSIAPAGHQTLWGCSQRLLILKETEDPNSVDIHVSRRGPCEVLRFTHPWIDISKAKELLQRGTSGTGTKKQTKFDQAVDWLIKHPQYISEGISSRQLTDTAKHHENDPLELSRNTWMEALKHLREAED